MFKKGLRKNIAGSISLTLFSSLLTLFVSAPAAHAIPAPAVPVITSVKFIGTRNVTIGFTQPDNGTAAASYLFNTQDSTATLSTSNTDNWQFNSGTTSPIILTNTSANGRAAFTLKTVYYFSLRSCNSAVASNSNETTENSNCSTASVRVTLAAGAPSAPTIDSVTTSDAAISVNFTAGDNGGYALSNYQYTTDGGTSWLALSTPSTTSPISITKLSTNGTTNLTNGTQYTVGLKAVNINGTSNASNYLTATPSGPPGAPTAVSAIAGNAQATVSWSPPTSNGGLTITSYTVTAQEISRTCTSSSIPLATSCTVTGLVNGNAYTFKVTATNASGTGSASTASTAVVVGTPTAPTITNLSPKNGSVDLTFSAGTSYAVGGITNYEYSLDGGSWVARNPASATSPMTISGLTNGTSYSIRIRAVDANGSGASSNTVSAAIPSVTTTAPLAPTITSITAGNTSLSVAFNVGSDGGSTITNYQYSTNNGSTWTTRSPSATTSPITISSLTNGTTYTVLIRAINSSPDNGGIGASSNAMTGTPAGAPAAPTSVTATNLSGSAFGNSGANLSWTAGSNSGSEILGYKIEKSTDGSTYSTAVSNTGSSATSYTVTGLTAGTYYFKVTAINAIGYGTASSASAATALTSRPSAPTITSITPGNATLSVAFTAPANNGGVTVTNYEYSTDDGLTWNPRATFGTASPLSITDISSDGVTNLVNNTSYTIKIRAYNAEGSGDSSASQTATPATSSTAPGSPTNLVATRANLSVGLSWSAPASNGGAPISDYKIEYKLSSASTWTTFTHTASTATSATIGSLVNGSSYDFRVSAINTSPGTSSPSDTASATPATTPGAPTALSATKGLASVALSWTAPTSTGGDALTNYSIQYSTDGTNWTTVATSSTATSETVTGLTNGTAYTFKVSAVNTVGIGTASSTATATPSASVPGAPTNLSATSGDQTITVSFTDPTSTGGAAITNYKYSTDNGATYRAFSTAITTSPASITTLSSDGTTRLAKGTSYTILLKATNSAGDSVASSSAVGTTFSNDATLSALTTTAGSISPTFASANISYTASVTNAKTTITVTPTRTQSAATITVNGTTVTSGSASGNISLNVGSNTISIIVTAQDGTSKTYTLTVTRATSNDATLSALTTTAGSISPSFASATISYTATVPFGTASVTVTPTVNQANATITVNGTAVSSGSASGSLTLSGSSTAISIVVTAQDGTTTKTYTLTVSTTAGSNDATLSALSTTAGTISPGFASGTIAYTASVLNGVSTVTVTPTLNDSNASVKVNGTTVASGSASGNINLAVGANDITIVVTAQNGTTTKTYTITVTRAGSSDATLSGLTTTAGSISFLSATTTYSVTVAYGTSTVTVTPTANQANATITVNGTAVTSGATSSSITLTSSSNDISIVVRAQDTTTTKTYTLTVIVTAASTDSSLSALSTTAGSISFVSTTLSYSATVAFATTSVKVTPTRNQSGATIKVNTVTVTSGSASGDLSLNVGSNTISIVVTAQDGTTTTTYTLTVTRSSPTVTYSSTSLSTTYGTVKTSVTPTVSAGYSPSYSISTITAAGGSATTGISIDSATGVVSATAAVLADTYTISTSAAQSGVTVNNSFTLTVDATDPDPPTLGTPSENDASVVINWTAPGNKGGTSIDHYTVSAYNSSGILITTCTANETATSCNVTGLTNGTTYTFKVTSTNKVGRVSAVTQTSKKPYTTPNAPSAPNVDISDTTATVTITEPSNGGDSITEYTITFIDTTANVTDTVNSTSLTKTITGLTNGHSYTFKVKAKNGKGYGSDGSTTGRSVAQSAHSLSLNAPVPSTRDYSATETDITATSSLGRSITSYVIAAGSADICEITGTNKIKPKKAGTCEYSITSSGTTEIANATLTGSFIIDSVAPAAPTGDTVTALNGSVSLSWDEVLATDYATSGGSPISKYVITVKSGGTTVKSVEVTSGHSTAISGLTNETTYTFEIVAVNTGGKSSSAKSASGTPSAGAKKSHNFTFTVTPSINYGDETKPISVATDPEDSVVPTLVIDSASSDVCQIVDGKIKPLKAGTCRYTATGADSATYTLTTASGSITILPVIPGAPAAPSASISGTTATLTLSDPTDKGGEDISEYTIEYTDTTSNTTYTTTSTSKTKTITSLTNGHSYTFKVQAKNSKGYGALSNASSSAAAAKLAHSLTSNSIIPTAANFSNGNISIAATSSQSKTVTYIVSTPTICEIDGTGIKMKKAGTCTYAINSAGGIDSEDAAPITGSIVIAAVSPSAPETINAAVLTGTTDVEITWVAPTFDGGDTVTYDVYDGATKICDSVSTNKCTHASLTPGSTHTYTVRSKNSAGNATSAAVSKNLNKASQILNISGVSNQTYGSDDITPTFTASVSGSDFTIDASSSLVCEKSGSKIKFIGAGSCKINATNAGDTTYDSASATTTISIAEATPESPTTISATASSTSVTLTWSALSTTSQRGGARSVTYTITSEPTSAGCTVVDATTCSISGLTEGQDYVFNVVASNSTKSSSRRSSSTVSIAKTSSPTTPSPKREPIAREVTPVPVEPTKSNATEVKNPVVINPEKSAAPAKTNEKPAVEAVKIEIPATSNQVVATTNGKTENANLIVASNTATVQGSDWNIAVVPSTASGKDAASSLSGTSTTQVPNSRITFEPGLAARTAGSGFKPNSTISVFIFSEATFLGNIATDENGNFDGQIVIPAEFQLGDHTLQVSGLTNENLLRSTSIGVTVSKSQNLLKFNILFGMGGSWLNASAYRTLRANLTKVPMTGNLVTVSVTGFAQTTLKQVNDAALAVARARAVAIGLRKLGLKAKFVLQGAPTTPDSNPNSRKAEVVINWNPKIVK